MLPGYDSSTYDPSFVKEMVLPARVFEIRKAIDLDSIAEKLKAFREEELYEADDKTTDHIVTEILDLEFDKDSINGIFSKDFILKRYHRRKRIENIVSEEAPFWIRSINGKNYLIILAPSVARGVKKLLSSHVALRLSFILFAESNLIVETRISHNALRELHESNPRATKLIWFDDVDLPGVKKLCLAGTGLADTELYKDYLTHGKIWYVVFEVQKYSIVIGISRDFSVTLFTQGTIREFTEYILNELLQFVEYNLDGPMNERL